MTIGDYIRQLRLSKGLSMNRLAQMSGISQSTLSRWESGKFLPSLRELEMTLTALNCTDSQRRDAIRLLDAPRAVAYLRSETASPHALTFGGDLLRAMRIRRNWTIEQVASAVGVSESVVRRWERSEQRPTDDQLHALCFALGASESELVALSQNAFNLQNENTFPEDIHEFQLWVDALKVSDMDLSFHALIADLQERANRNPFWLSHIALAYTSYASYLMFEYRIREAEKTALKAIQLFPTLPEVRPHMLWSVNVLSSAVHYSGSRMRPLEGAEVLMDWIPPDGSLRWGHYRQWFLARASSFMAQAGHGSEAERMLKEADNVNLRLIGEERVSRNSIYSARVALAKGNPRLALSQMPKLQDDWPPEAIPHHLLKAEIFCALKNPDRARDEVKQAYVVASRSGLPHAYWIIDKTLHILQQKGL